MYPKIKVGEEVCSTLVYINTDKAGGKSIAVNSLLLRKNDGHFKIDSVSPVTPMNLKPGDTLKVTICFKPTDTLEYDDSIVIKTDCFDASLPIVGSAGTPLIYATDIDFGDVVVGGKKCLDLTVSNRGSLPFTLTKNWLLHDTSVFSMDLITAGYLPFILQPGKAITMTFCYSPKSLRPDSTTVDWVTDIEQPFTNKIKSWSYLKGNPIKPFVRWDREKAFFIPDSAAGVDSVILRVNLLNGSTATATIRNVFIAGSTASEFYILDNQRNGNSGPFGNFNMKVGDTIWVDVVFKPDLTKPYPERYANRIDSLVATYMSPETHSDDAAYLTLIGTWNKSDVKLNAVKPSFSIHPNPVTGNSVVISFTSPQQNRSDLQIFDLLGKEVYKIHLEQGITQIEIPIRNLPKGLYFARLVSGNAVSTQKFEILE